MTWQFAFIVLALSVAIALPLAILIEHVRREMLFRKHMAPVRKAIATEAVANCEEVKLTGKRCRAAASVTEIGALTSKHVTTKG